LFKKRVDVLFFFNFSITKPPVVHLPAVSYESLGAPLNCLEKQFKWNVGAYSKMAAILQEESTQHMAPLGGQNPKGAVESLYDTFYYHRFY